MMLEPSSTFRRARLATIALATAAFITLSDNALAQRADRPPLDVPYVPTPPEVVDRMLEMAAVQPEDFVIDLGSGDGRIAIAAARKGARALGIDIDPERIIEAEDNARKAGVQDKVRFQRQNLFDTKLGDATVLTMYLLTKVNLDLRPRILEELKPGTRVVSHSFDMGDWKPDIHYEVGHRQVFMWIVPAKAAGRWQGKIGAESLGLDLQQEYQYLKGSAQIAGRTIGGARGLVARNRDALDTVRRQKAARPHRWQPDAVSVPADPGDKPRLAGMHRGSPNALATLRNTLSFPTAAAPGLPARTGPPHARTSRLRCAAPDPFDAGMASPSSSASSSASASSRRPRWWPPTSAARRPSWAPGCSAASSCCWAPCATPNSAAPIPTRAASITTCRAPIGFPVGLLFAWARGTVIQTGAIAAVAFVYGDYAAVLIPLGAYGAAIHAVHRHGSRAHRASTSPAPLQSARCTADPHAADHRGARAA